MLEFQRPAMLVAALTFATAACSTTPGTLAAPTARASGPHLSASPSAGAGTPVPQQQGQAPTAGPDQEDEMKIEIVAGDQRFTALLAESAAARDLLDQLPVTVEMTDHGSVEKTGPLLSPLSLRGQPAGADPVVGDVGYYAPGNDLVLYYGDQSYYPGIVILGRMDGGAAGQLAQIDGSVTATVAAYDG